MIFLLCLFASKGDVSHFLKSGCCSGLGPLFFEEIILIETPPTSCVGN